MSKRHLCGSSMSGCTEAHRALFSVWLPSVQAESNAEDEAVTQQQQIPILKKV